VGIALCVVFGMVLASLELIPFNLLFFSALFMLLCSVLLIRSRSSTVLVFSCVALVAACRFMLGAQIHATTDINQLPLPIENIRLIGCVSGPPEFHAYRSGDKGVWIVPLKCEGLNISSQWTRRRGVVQVRVFGAPPDLNLSHGARIQLSGTLQKNTFPGGEPIDLMVSGPDDLRILTESSGFSLSGWGEQLRESAAKRLSIGLEDHPDQLAVLKALLLGYRKAVPSEITTSFSRTGTMHIFAISGLHVGIVGLLLTVVLKAIGISRDKWGLLLIPLLLMYVISTGMKSSALRAVTMAAVYFLAPLFRRRPDVPTSIAFAAMLLLLIQPASIQSAGFIFSFIVVSFIVMFFATVPERILVQGRGWGRAVWSYGMSLGVTTLAAFTASVPLAALYFGMFSPVSLIGNLIVVPLTFCIVLSGWLSILVPFASEIFNYAALTFINGLLGTVNFFADLPGAYRPVAIPPLLGMVFWYAGWIYFFTHARSFRQKRVALALVLLAVIWGTLPPLLLHLACFY